MTPIIRVDHLRHTYSAGTPFEKVAIDDIDLAIPAGQFVGIIGHTGSGKSTFIQHLNGLLAPTSGTVLFDGEDIHRSKAATRDVRFQVGLVFQYPEHQLFEETVYQDIAFGPKNAKLSTEEVDARVREASRFAGVDEALFERSPLELSGGQKRRIAIAGVIAMRPQVLILDEPTAGLDPAGCRGVLENIAAYRRETGSAVLLVTCRARRLRRRAGGGLCPHAGAARHWPRRAAGCAHRAGTARPGRRAPAVDLYARAAHGCAARRREGGGRMLKDVTLGQFFPGSSIVHRLDPRCKLLLTIVYIAALFTAESYVSYAVMLIITGVCIALSRIQLKVILRGLKPLWIIIALTAVLNMFFTPGRELVSFWKITVTYEGLIRAVFMVLRITMLIAGTFLLTYTTSPIALTDAMEILFGPLKKLKVPVHEMSMMMSMALRFIPTLIEETDKIMSAQKARGADFETGNLIQRAKALLPLLVPLFVSAFRRADELAVAMECRCYHGDEGRTRMKQLTWCTRDTLAMLWSALVLAGVIVLARFGL